MPSQETNPLAGLLADRIREASERERTQWRPNPGPQEAFVTSAAFEVMYGGAAGGGKTIALLHDALRGVEEPSYAALLLRKTFPELERNLINASHEAYPRAIPGCKYNEAKKTWRFPSGARIMFGYLDSDKDVYQYQGAEFQYVGFDELTHFSERQYTYLISRLRHPFLPVRLRATTNPGGDGHEWVFRRWAPWLDPTSTHRVAPGEVLRYDNTEDGEVYRPEGLLSRVFIPAKLSDTPQLSNTNYGVLINGLDPVTRARLRDGDWLIRPARGLYFKRGWFDTVPKAPDIAQRVRYWDRAASEDGDWTVGLKMAIDANRILYVEDIVRFRGRPHEVESKIMETAANDGRHVMIGIEQDPGQAGTFEASYYIRKLGGFNVRAFKVTKAKITRAQPISAQAEAQHVKLVESKGADWHQAFLQEIEEFPEGKYDDQVDAFSGAYSALLTSARPVLRVINHTGR